mmetsp:Transcript_103839/g.303104  ORF Transcript_103839/g.303104 Transcript_103839/m.303104 type:complete len:197 (-) Transcript_103839:60-650(-)
MRRRAAGRKMALAWPRALSVRAAIAAALCCVCCCLARAPGGSLFAGAARVGLRGEPRTRTALARGAGLAPMPVKPKTDTPGLPEPVDEARHGEAVRWLFEEEMEEPPAWNLLLLDKTFEEESNTSEYVVACLVAVLGLARGVAMQKTAHAREHYFAVLETCKDQKDAFAKARELRDRNLLVRVCPAASLPEVGDDE